MKLLICTQSIDPKDPIAGFFSTWVHEFAKHVDAVTVIALSGVGKETLPKNVRVLSLQKEQGAGKFRQLFLFYCAIITTVKEYDAVFVHNVGPKFVILGAPVWKLFHKQIALWYVHKSVDWKLRVGERFSDVIFSSAPEAFRIASKKIHFLGHGIDTEALGRVTLRPDPATFTVLQVGRITPIKHCEVLVSAAARLKDTLSTSLKVQFVGTPLAVGDAEYFSELRRKVTQLGLEKEVEFLGGIAPEDLRDYYARAHVTVNTVPTGGMDKVVLESAAMGVPAITTNQTFGPVFGELADQFVLPELNETSDQILTDRLTSIARNGVSSKERLLLQKKVRERASLPVLIQRVIQILEQL